VVRGEGPSDGPEVVEVVAEDRLVAVGDLGLRDGVEVGHDGLDGSGGDAAHDLPAGLVRDALGQVGFAAPSTLEIRCKQPFKNP